MKILDDNDDMTFGLGLLPHFPTLFTGVSRSSLALKVVNFT